MYGIIELAKAPVRKGLGAFIFFLNFATGI